ncbi:hypothetical protein AB6I73_000828 [Citrobacter amalonaticus]|uniref:hypothetical protein n=1 Tax=Citrobacter TaxID=544 RepID=UPI000E19B81D|nr:MULTISPECIES: hypothetical protein [Citrobacter]EKW5096494.1 hypothetical protein [Citrobacter amalonaticus]MBJ9317212.1 hypothetical protein [Citrobacter amalonaticus]MDM3521789.1 hypothetical protein [Citrobacter sp. Ca225]UBI22395.1 hypothetical protein LA348_09895 [Citrobacter amalonaticus]SUX65162.1 Uncharacterised protein [Citrobacter amalonaticus]
MFKNRLATKKVVAITGNIEIGTVSVSASQKSISLNTGWELPIIKVDKPSHSYEVYIKPRHKTLHPSRWWK